MQACSCCTDDARVQLLTAAARHPLKIEVEAAGIEPASESPPLFGSTCLSRALSSSGESSTGPLPAGPSPNESRLPPSERHGRPADFFGGTCRRHRLGSGVPRA